ncbi:hypothetical protein MP228_007666 [Amoeboaphelidium protococcarum]|nr:hypothetical protein MP228_007666 [Amoeboaphelidium protococcarum]
MTRTAQRLYKTQYEPYDIQVKMMDALYECIGKHKVGLFASPTGTGKSSSLLCGTLQWIIDEQESIPEHLQGEEDWVVEHLKRKKLAIQQKLSTSQNQSNDLRHAIKRVKKVENNTLGGDDDDDDDLLPEDYEESSLARARRLYELLDEPEPADDSNQIRLIFCSRTHSQLNQIVHELRGTGYNVKGVTLASRKNYCIHPQVNKFNDVLRLNDACKDLIQKEQCSYYDETLLQQYADLSEPLDIEELVQYGKRIHVCPYYGSQKAISSSTVITMPYNFLLSKQSRDAAGLNIKDQIIVIDEAHNVLDAITQTVECPVKFIDIAAALQSLELYLVKYHSRLKGVNMVYIKQLIKFLKEFDGVSSSSTENVFQIEDFLLTCKLEDLNLHRIIEYLEKSKLPFKVLQFQEQSQAQDLDARLSAYTSKYQSPLHLISRFLQSLTYPSASGRVIKTEDSFKFCLLNPSELFADVVREARCVILAGGTMEPVDEYLSIIPTEFHDDIFRFSCDHIIPPDNLCLISLKQGPSKQQLHFTYENRSNEAMIKELFVTLYNLTSVVPNGLVVFFPSYSTMDSILASWTKDKFMDRLSKKKDIYTEPKLQQDLDNVFKSYGESALSQKGAILFSVVGGKMSEGINFKDELCRCVLMVGLPYPSIASVEIQVKMAYLDDQKRSNPLGISGKEYYENLCMKAVNQSIGRAIRHKNDYAAIVLVDQRYDNDKIVKKLPHWMTTNMHRLETFGESMITLTRFFQAKRKTEMR